ncbi:MAG: sel1 repeat family protein [Phenylobacterium sp.]|nr:sel1 repeat family protein [Phenylobacterium sp.]
MQLTSKFGDYDMQKLRLVFWWLVSLGALGSALLCFEVVQAKPWLSYLYVASALALVAGLIANPLVRPRIGLGTRPIITLVMLVVLTIGGVLTLGMVLDQAMIHGRTERSKAVKLNNEGLAAEAKDDYVVANALYDQACAAGLAVGCYNHGALNGAASQFGGKDLEMARKSYRKACDLKFPDACASLGGMMVLGEGGTIDIEGGRALLRQACDSGRAMACLQVQVLDHGIPSPSP